MGQERVLRTFILAAMGLALFAYLKPASPDPMENTRARLTWFYLNKTHQPPEYDAVIIGDSRGLRGISPGTMEKILPDLQIFNFSFNAGGMNPEMFTEAEKLLSDTASQPIIILATTSLSFQTWKQDNSQFREYAAKPRDQVWMYLKGGNLSEYFQPMSPAIFPRKWLGMKPPVLVWEEFHQDGWIASDQQPWSDYSDLTEHQQKLAPYRVDQNAISNYMSQVRDWTSNGILVIGFTPPSNPATIEVEDAALDFDPSGFRSQFETAGGTWLDLPREGYETYDGSHLTKASAVRFSEVLAQSIARYLPPAAAPPMHPSAR